MKGSLMALMLCCAMWASGKETQQQGRVTYVAAGTVYTSLGRANGVNDSSSVFVVEGADTIALLQVFALSSKSTACRVVRSTREIRPGMEVVAFVPVAEQKPSETTVYNPAQDVAPSTDLRALARKVTPAMTPSWIDMKGRISAQFQTTTYDNSVYDISQPGLVINLRGRVNDLPILFEVYGNLRTLSYAGASPFSKDARNQSRIYRISLSYNDGVNVASIGRIAPQASPSIGYIDGLLLSRKLDNFTVGGTFGYQPSFTLRGISTDYRKFALFTRYETEAPFRGSITAAYARTYFHSLLDREVANTYINFFSSTNLAAFASADVDLRKKSGERYKFSPSLSTAFMSANYRATESLTLGLGADASRPVYPFSAVRMVPDSLLDLRLRAGLSFSAGVFLPWGISLSNTYTPRSSSGSGFGREYSDYAGVTFTNIGSSGVTLRSNITVNSTTLTRSRGYGAQIQRNLLGLLDLTLRYQQYNYTVTKIEMRSRSTTLGADLMVTLTRSLGLVASYDRLDGYGTRSNALFAEFSVRF